MEESQNWNPYWHHVDEVAMEQEKPPTAGHGRKFISGFLFLFVLVCLLGGIVRHYSLFSTGGKFLLKTEDSGVISGHHEVIEYQRLLIRNRFPFELTVTVRLCSIDREETLPRFSVLDERSWDFVGKRSFYSGTFETRLNIITSGDGRFHVTDHTGKPDELLNLLAGDTQTPLQNLWINDAKLRTSLANDLKKGKFPSVSDIKEDRLTYAREIIKTCSLPGEHPDKVLVITLRQKANYGR